MTLTSIDAAQAGQVAGARDGQPRRTRPPRRPWWRRPRPLLALLGLLLLAVLAAALLTTRQSAPTTTAPPTAAPLIAHGQIVPTRVAHVGTQGGGVVQQLGASLGGQVQAQAPLAWVDGPNGTTEIVTAPFSGAVTNVLVHAGDTLVPGATIAVVADLHTLQVETSDVDEFLVSHIQVGQSVPITIDALDDAPISGIVTNVGQLPQTGTGGNQAYPVIVRVDGLPAAARAGMSVRLTFAD
jgi:biotin carboxyl carrier protein